MRARTIFAAARRKIYHILTVRGARRRITERGCTLAKRFLRPIHTSGCHHDTLEYGSSDLAGRYKTGDVAIQVSKTGNNARLVQGLYSFAVREKVFPWYNTCRIARVSPT